MHQLCSLRLPTDPGAFAPWRGGVCPLDVSSVYSAVFNVYSAVLKKCIETPQNPRYALDTSLQATELRYVYPKIESFDTCSIRGWIHAFDTWFDTRWIRKSIRGFDTSPGGGRILPVLDTCAIRGLDLGYKGSFPLDLGVRSP